MTIHHDLYLDAFEPQCTGQSDDGCHLVTSEFYGPCDACGYITHDIPQEPSDSAHEELCCGQSIAADKQCSAIGHEVGICITHNVYDGVQE